jgi:hypothetical protein
MSEGNERMYADDFEPVVFRNIPADLRVRLCYQLSSRSKQFINLRYDHGYDSQLLDSANYSVDFAEQHRAVICRISAGERRWAVRHYNSDQWYIYRSHAIRLYRGMAARVIHRHLHGLGQRFGNYRIASDLGVAVQRRGDRYSWRQLGNIQHSIREHNNAFDDTRYGWSDLSAYSFERSVQRRKRHGTGELYQGSLCSDDSEYCCK